MSNYFLYYTPFVLLTIVLVMGIRVFKYADKSIRALVFLMAGHLLFQFSAIVIIKMEGSNALIYKVGLVYYLVCTFLIFFYLNKHKYYRAMVLGAFSIAAILIGYNYALSFSDIYGLSESILIQNLVIIFASLTYFFVMLKNISLVPLLKQWRFMLVLAFLMYALVSSASWMVDYIANAKGINSYATRIVNDYIYMIELLVLIWAMWIYTKDLKGKSNIQRA